MIARISVVRNAPFPSHPLLFTHNDAAEQTFIRRRLTVRLSLWLAKHPSDLRGKQGVRRE